MWQADSLAPGLTRDSQIAVFVNIVIYDREHNVEIITFALMHLVDRLALIWTEPAFVHVMPLTTSCCVTLQLAPLCTVFST